jgi:hypothetical protein
MAKVVSPERLNDFVCLSTLEADNRIRDRGLIAVSRGCCMVEWLTIDNVRSFAGPVATVFASAVAAYFAWAQVQVAKTQAAIAYDKLKFDLFEKRYAIYCTTKDLIEHAISNGDQRIDFEFVRKSRVRLDESRFFFDNNIRKCIGEVDNECEEFLKLILFRKKINSDEDGLWANTADKLAEQVCKLSDLYKGLPQKFEKALAFQQLTERDQ